MYEIMDTKAPSYEVDEALYHELVELAQPHVEKADGKLGILEFDPDQYDWQRHDVYCTPGEVANVEVLDLIGSNVTPHFVELSDELMVTKRRQQARGVLKSGKSLYIATSHSNLIDPGIGLGVVTNPLRREKHEWNDFETGIIVNVMLSVLKYRVHEEQWMPCMQVLKLLCNRVYRSYPQSETFRQSAAGQVLPEGHIPRHNGHLKTDIDYWMAKGGVALGVAPSGSTHKEKAHGWKKNIKLIMPEFTEGTSKMMAHRNIRILSLIMDLDAEQPFIEPASEDLYIVKRWRGAHRIPRDMAKAFNRRREALEEGTLHVYQGGRAGLSDIPLLGRLYVVQESMQAEDPPELETSNSRQA